MNRAILAIALALTVAACGNRTELQPQAGQSLPVAPRGSAERPTASQLLARTPQAAPERNVELRRRSEERQDDPFDLPPIDPRRRLIPPDPATIPVCEEDAAGREDSNQLACRPVDAQFPAQPG